VWINPFWEDDLDVLLAAMGPERIMFGSDWPHVEGLRHPLDYLSEVAHLDEKTQRRILHDNAAELLSG
jgi:predicted TIM-barrel fold metal-dependent hydrolase